MFFLLFVFLLVLLGFCLFFQTVISNYILDHLPVKVHVCNTGQPLITESCKSAPPLWLILAGGTAKGTQTALLPLVNRCGLERLMKTTSTILTIRIQNVETRYIYLKQDSCAPTLILRSADLATRMPNSLCVPLSCWFTSTSSLFLSLPEHFCRPDQSGCNMLRQYIFASVVPQPGAAPQPLWVQQLQSGGTQHRFWYFTWTLVCFRPSLNWDFHSVAFYSSIFRVRAPVHLRASAVFVCALAEQQQEVHRPLGSGQSSGPGHRPAAGTPPR